MKWVGYFLVLGAPAAAAGVACVLADPPPIDSLPPESRPLFVSESVLPPLGQPLDAPPANLGTLTFTLVVRADPNEQVLVEVIEDFVPESFTGPPQFLYPPAPLAFSDAGALFTLDAGEALQTGIVTVAPIEPTRCHSITAVVAAAHAGFLAQGTPGPPGGDQVTWLYEPTGVSCSAFDAAPPTFQPDAGDAGDGSGE